MKPTQTPTTAPASDPMRPSALLRGAALYLFWHGWTQHQFYHLVADTTGPFPPACTSGAVITAATGHCPMSGIFTDSASVDDHDALTDAAIRAMRYLADRLNTDLHRECGYSISAIDVIGDWNDVDGRTVGEVIETLTDAADEWDRTHPSGGAR